jgi:hypothetical protein
MLNWAAPFVAVFWMWARPSGFPEKFHSMRIFSGSGERIASRVHQISKRLVSTARTRDAELDVSESIRRGMAMVKCRFAMFFILVLGLAIAAGSQSAASFDWPQWRGPDRSGLSKETGLLKNWPASGPSRVWLASGLGAGFGSISVQGDRVYVQGLKGRDSTISSLERATGRAVWSRVIGPGRGNDRGPGPRGTPTVDADRLYVLTENGDLACLKVQDGSVLWQRNVLTDFGGRNIPWLISESPLVDGDRVIVTPGGQGAGMVALDKMTGKTLWSSKELSDAAACIGCGCRRGGVRTLITLTESAGVGVRATDGSSCGIPAGGQQHGQHHRPSSAAQVFYTSNYGTGARSWA